MEFTLKIKLGNAGMEAGDQVAAEMDGDMLEGMADVLSKMSDSQRKKLEALMSAKAKGIKKSRRIHKISLGSRDLTLADEEESTGMGKDGTMVHKHTITSELFECGHAASKEDFGHVAECGHVICRNCVVAFSLMCAFPGCMKKLCSVPGCYLKVADGVSFCNMHGRFAIYDSRN